MLEFAGLGPGTFCGMLLADDPLLPDRTDRSSWPALRDRFTAVFASRSRAEWWAVVAGTDACVAPSGR